MYNLLLLKRHSGIWHSWLHENISAHNWPRLLLNLLLLDLLLLLALLLLHLISDALEINLLLLLLLLLLESNRT